jgi:hypothetical protein
MKIPKSLNIKGEKWKIKFKRKLINDKGEDCYGLTLYEERTIYLEKSLEGDLLNEVFMHEFFHASLRELHIEIDPDLNETICDGLGYITNKLFDWTLKKLT